MRNLTRYGIENKNFALLCYADDAVLLADTEGKLQRILYITITIHHSSTNRKNEIYMVISKEPVRCKLEIEEKILQQLMNFKYLSIDMSSDHKKAQFQAIKEAQISKFLLDVAWNNKYMNVVSKVKLYKTFVRHMGQIDEPKHVGLNYPAEFKKTRLRVIVGKTSLDRLRL